MYICSIEIKHSFIPAQVKINYTLILDATRKHPKNRAYSSGKQQEESGSVIIDLRRKKCSTIKFLIEVKPNNKRFCLMNFIFKTRPNLNLNLTLLPSCRPVQKMLLMNFPIILNFCFMGCPPTQISDQVFPSKLKQQQFIQ